MHALLSLLLLFIFVLPFLKLSFLSFLVQYSLTKQRFLPTFNLAVREKEGGVYIEKIVYKI